MPKTFNNFDNPRSNALSTMKKSISIDVWNQNTEFLKSLREKISQHPVSTHPAINILNNGILNLEQLQLIHLEYRHAIVQIFTDALLMAQFQTKQLEPRLEAGSKMAARFLLSLNILDEFGFRPGTDKNGYYLGNPEYAHYPLFEEVLTELGIMEDQKKSYIPSKIAEEVRKYLEDSYDKLITVSALLAVAEEEVILFSPPLRQAVKGIGLAVNSGYYFVHGVSNDELAEAADDDHEDDLWYILAQACTEKDYDYLSKICIEYCELWCKFWDYQLENLNINLIKAQNAG